jgi:hypothetical protein
MKNTKPVKRHLKLMRNTLRVLATTELTAVAGGVNDSGTNADAHIDMSCAGKCVGAA